MEKERIEELQIVLLALEKKLSFISNKQDKNLVILQCEKRNEDQEVIIFIQDCKIEQKIQRTYYPSLLSSFFTKDKFYIEEHAYIQYRKIEKIQKQWYYFGKFQNVTEKNIQFIKKLKYYNNIQPNGKQLIEKCLSLSKLELQLDGLTSFINSIEILNSLQKRLQYLAIYFSFNFDSLKQIQKRDLEKFLQKVQIVSLKHFKIHFEAEQIQNYQAKIFSKCINKLQNLEKLEIVSNYYLSQESLQYLITFQDSFKSLKYLTLDLSKYKIEPGVMNTLSKALKNQKDLLSLYLSFNGESLNQRNIQFLQLSLKYCKQLYKVEIISIQEYKWSYNKYNEKMEYIINSYTGLKVLNSPALIIFKPISNLVIKIKQNVDCLDAIKVIRTKLEQGKLLQTLSLYLFEDLFYNDETIPQEFYLILSEAIFQCSDLQSIDLRIKDIPQIGEQLASLKKLESFKLECNQYEYEPYLEQFIHIKNLHFDNSADYFQKKLEKFEQEDKLKVNLHFMKNLSNIFRNLKHENIKILELKFENHDGECLVDGEEEAIKLINLFINLKQLKFTIMESDKIETIIDDYFQKCTQLSTIQINILNEFKVLDQKQKFCLQNKLIKKHLRLINLIVKIEA